VHILPTMVILNRLAHPIHSRIAIFDSLILLFLAAFLLAVPVIYDRYDKLKHLARALRVIRVACVCNGIGVFFSLLTA
jgi:hypothetical protein